MLTKKGTITSAGKMQNTITVSVHQFVNHPLYKKSFRRDKKFLVDTNNISDLAVGDEVVIQECRPLSKRKHFKLIEVLKRVPRVSEMADESAVSKTLNRDKQTSVDASASTPQS